MKIIFLDIDGVICYASRDRDEYGNLFETELVDNLRYIIEETGAKIVITSTWRRQPDALSVMQNMWKHRGLPGEVIDVTPVFGTSKTYSYTIPRGCEIEWWLKNKDWQRINWSRKEQERCLEYSKVKNYVILDDDSDMLLCQAEHYVCCSGSDAVSGDVMLPQENTYGLTRSRAEKAVKILNADIIELYNLKYKP